SKNNFDMIIVDFRMPGMNGAEFIAEARKIPIYQKTPILVLSSETSEDKKKEAKISGATGWIKKPFEIDKFINIIKKFR
ncbi:MAG: response regulator, partial [bacterium]|nr:response regulator [bacterium]